MYEPETTPDNRIMHRGCSCVDSDVTTRDAIDMMEEYRIKRLPVAGIKGGIVGMISQAGIAQHVGHELTGELVETVSMGPPMQHPI